MTVMAVKAEATPYGIELLAEIRERKGREPSWIDMMPWWDPDEHPTQGPLLAVSGSKQFH
jgi:hypothetical protein